MTGNSKEREYAIRICWLVMTVGRDVARQNLDAIFSPGTGPGSLNEKLNKASVRNTIHNLTRVFNSLDISKLYPSPATTVSSNDFDISLLIKLLRNIGRLPAPPRGWDNLPLPSNISLSDDIARIKYYRNKIAHNEDFMLSEVQFDDFWKDLTKTLIRRGGNVYEPIINRILTNPLTEAAEESKKELHLWYLKDLDVNMKFDTQLEKLKNMLQALERNRHNDKLLEEVRSSYKLFQDEHSKLVGEISDEQKEIHLQNMAAMDTFGCRLHELENSVNRRDRFRDQIISFWQLIIFSVITVVAIVYFSQSSTYSVSFSFIIAVGGIIFYKLIKRRNTEPILRPVPIRSTPDLIGRDGDIENIKKLLKEDRPLVVIRAPYGFGTSEVAVATARQWGKKVIHIDLRDIGHLVSTEIIILLGLHPLPDTKSQLRSLYSQLSSTLFVFDNLDFVIRNQVIKADFEMVLRFLTDRNICKDVKVLCATQQTISILSELGDEYLLPPLNHKESCNLFIQLRPTLTSEDANNLAKASMGIPLAITLMNNLLREGYTPQGVLNGIEADIGNLDEAPGLEEHKKLTTITLQYIRSLEQSTQTGLKSLAYLFDCSFESTAAMAVLQGSDFDRKMLIIKLNTSSLVSYDNFKSRYYIHQFFQRLVAEKYYLNKDINLDIIKRHREHFMSIIYKATGLWFSRNSKEATRMIRLETSNILRMFKLVAENGIDIEDLNHIFPFLDISVVQLLLEFIKSEKVAGFVGNLSSCEGLSDESVESNVIKLCVVHSYLDGERSNREHLDELFLSTLSSIDTDSLPFNIKLHLFVDKARLLNERDQLLESVETLNIGLTMVLDVSSSNDKDVLSVGTLLAEVSFLLFTYFNNVAEKHKMFSSDKDILWVEGMQKSVELNTSATNIRLIEETIDNPSIVKVVKCTDFCRQNSLDKCLREILGHSTKAQAISLALYIKVLGQNHKMTGFSFDRLAFLLHNIESYERSVEFRYRAIEIRKIIFNGDHPDLAWSYYGLGTSLEQLGRLGEALKAHQISLNIRKSLLANHYLTAKSYFKVGHLSRQLGFTGDAIQALSKTIEIRKSIKDEPELIARALCEYGDLLSSTDDEELQNEALKIYEEERKYIWRNVHSEAKKRLKLQEDERSGQGSQGWGHSFIQSTEPDDDGQIEWIRMQVSTSGEVLGHGFIADEDHQHNLMA